MIITRLKGFLIVALLLLTIPLFARHRLSTFEAVMFNDNLSFGLGENPDDMRSYGMFFGYFNTSGWFGNIEISGLTLRGKGGDPGRRYDELILKGGYVAHFHLPTKDLVSSYEITPYGGLALAGNFGLEAIQNFVHDLFKLGQLHEVYEGDGEQHILPILGLAQKYEVIDTAPWFRSSELLFWAELDITYIPTYMRKIFPKVSVGQHTLSTSQFMVGGGYAFVDILDDWLTHQVVGSAEGGLTFFFKGHIGLITFGYNWYVESMEGYGGVGVQLVFGERLPWERSDLLVSFGLAIPDQISTFTFRYHLFKDIGIYLKNSFKMIPITEVSRVRENYSTWHAGVDWEISRWDFGWARPYLAAGMGFNRFLVMSDGAPPQNRIRDLLEVTFSAEIMAGLRFFNRGEIQYHGSAYGLELTGGLLLNDNSRVTLPDYTLELNDVWRPYFKIGLTVGTIL